MSKKKHRKKHHIAPKPKGPQSEQFRKGRKRNWLILGMSDDRLYDLGYKHKLGRLQKVLFVISILPFLMLPFWFLLEKKRFAQRAIPALIAFFLNLAVWAGIAGLIWRWLR